MLGKGHAHSTFKEKRQHAVCQLATTAVDSMHKYHGHTQPYLYIYGRVHVQDLSMKQLKQLVSTQNSVPAPGTLCIASYPG